MKKTRSNRTSVHRMVSAGAACLLLLTPLGAGCDSADKSGPEVGQRTAYEPPAVTKGRLSFVDGYAAGYRQAVRTGRPMLVFFTADWCGYCHQMEADAFTDEEVVELSRKFVCVIIDSDREQELCRQYRVAGYPTIQFLSPNGVSLHQVVGKRPADQLADAMRLALDTVAERSGWPDPSTRVR